MKLPSLCIVIILVLMALSVVCAQDEAEATSTCPVGKEEVHCFVDPCSTAAKCESNLSAKCKANYCGGCNAIFYDDKGSIVNCGDKNDEQNVESMQPGMGDGSKSSGTYMQVDLILLSLASIVLHFHCCA